MAAANQKIGIPAQPLTLSSGDAIYLIAATGQYPSVVNAGGTDYTQAAKSGIASFASSR